MVYGSAIPENAKICVPPILSHIVLYCLCVTYPHPQVLNLLHILLVHIDLQDSGLYCDIFIWHTVCFDHVHPRLFLTLFPEPLLLP